MEKYQAQKNNVNSSEEVPEKSQDEINAENNAKNIQNAAEVAIASKNPYAMAAGYAVKAADKLTGGKATQMAGEKMNQLNKMAPGGQQIQDASNKLSESGASDAIGSVASAKNGASQGGGAGKTAGGSSGKLGGLGGASGSSGSSSGSSSGGGSFNMGSLMQGNPMQKYMLLGGLGGVFLLLMLLILLADPDDMNMSLTNTTLNFTSNGVRNCTQSEIENNLIYVGDKSVNNINSSINNSEITYISSDTANLDWFNNTAVSEIENKLTENPSGVVLISLGLNDMSNIENYINVYRELINKYPKQVFINSINPVDETKQSTYTNIDIENFNKKLSDNFGANFIDTYSTLGIINTTDGINYDNATYETLHSTLTSGLSTSGIVECSTGLTNLVYYSQVENPYKNMSYGYGATIGSHGCGPVAVAMILSTLTGQTITPKDTAQYSLANGFKTSAGTSAGLFPSISQHYGINCDTVSLSQDSITEQLTQSKPIIMLVGPGIFTSQNHFIVLTGISNDGKVSIADPLDRNKSNQLWDINTLLGEGTGSSVWAFSV